MSVLACEVVHRFRDGMKTTNWAVIDRGHMVELDDDVVREAVIEYYERYMQPDCDEHQEYKQCEDDCECCDNPGPCIKESKPEPSVGSQEWIESKLSTLAEDFMVGMAREMAKDIKIKK